MSAHTKSCDCGICAMVPFAALPPERQAKEREFLGYAVSDSTPRPDGFHDVTVAIGRLVPRDLPGARGERCLGCDRGGCVNPKCAPWDLPGGDTLPSGQDGQGATDGPPDGHGDERGTAVASNPRAVPARPVSELPQAGDRDQPSAYTFRPSGPDLACSFCRMTGVRLVGGDVDSDVWVCANCAGFHHDILCQEHETSAGQAGSVPPGVTSALPVGVPDDRRFSDLPPVIYATRSGGWFPREYPHLETAKFWRVSNIDHFAKALNNVMAERDAALAALRGVVEALTNDPPRLSLAQARAVEAARKLVTP